MASIHKRPCSRFFHAAYTDSDGTRRLRSTGTADRKLAQRNANEYEALARQGRDQRLTIQRVRDVLNDITLAALGENLPSDRTADFLGQWLKRKRAELSESSFSAYAQAVNAFVEFIGPRAKRPLDSINKAIIADWRDSMLQRVAPGTARKMVVIIRAAFNDAICEGRMRENPAAKPKIKRNGGNKRRPFKPDELQRLLAAADQEWQAMIYAGYYTGARLGDIASLDWDNIDLEAGEVRFTATKTGKDMILPLADTLRVKLVELPSYDRGGPVFPEAHQVVRSSGTGTLSNQFRAIMYQAGLAEKPSHTAQKQGRGGRREFSPLTFHSLRHNYVTNLKMSGAGDSVARELAGHSTAAVSRIYTQTDKEVLKQAVSRIQPIPEAVS
jgi:integrase